ncbi:hypothetical protein [Aeromonas enteropelogenes]|uniref:hypothetical protein n=1 Tax=Aeromonas enteropelogenes TaxID=29489 RepID=UPI001624512F|nr:hypothetical protein [Aeromonas enteropelogenes]
MKITFSISIAPDFMDLAFLFRQLAAGLPLGIGIAIKTPKGKKIVVSGLQPRRLGTSAVGSSVHH